MQPASTARAAAEFDRIRIGARHAASLGLEVHAGHGLDYVTAEAIAGLTEVMELNIGHFLVGEAIFGGLATAVARMRAAMDRGVARRPAAAPARSGHPDNVL
jgi:pyridoxine 5-phosphate synthase